MIPARLLAFDGAPAKLFEKGEELLKTHFGDVDFNFTANAPFVLFFLSGGSERAAIEAAAGSDFCLLLAYEDNNSTAAATEVNAWMQQNGKACLLADINEPDGRKTVIAYLSVYASLNTLQQKKVGLIGASSDWLVASDIDAHMLSTRLGISMQKILWRDVPNYKTQKADSGMLEKFPAADFDMQSAAKIHNALKQVVQDRRLDAFTIECFPMVQHDGVTACLSLSDFNDNGIPAGCEGDLTSIAGMMFLQAVTGLIPWMANLVKIGSDYIKLAHCTAPTGLLESFTVDTHFETGKGTAVSGIFAKGEITIFRFDSSLGQAFLSSGRITNGSSSPAGACRTQIEAKLPVEKVNSLKTNPLGNHHLVLPGNFNNLIRRACRIKKIDLI